MFKKILLLLIILISISAIVITSNRQDKAIPKDKILFLELTPFEKKLRVYGNFVELQYIIEPSIATTSDKGNFIVQLDENNIGKIKKIYDGEKLADNELLIPYIRGVWGNIVIKPNSLAVKSDKVKNLLKAKYAVLKIINNTDIMLTGIADEQRNMIEVR